MGFRFQRRFKIFPGVSVNLSKSGVSASVGTRGAHVTVARGQVRETVGLPGTGLSYTQTQKIGGDAADSAPPPARRHKLRWVLLLLILFLAAIAAVRILAAR